MSRNNKLTSRSLEPFLNADVSFARGGWGSDRSNVRPISTCHAADACRVVARRSGLLPRAGNPRTDLLGAARHLAELVRLDADAKLAGNRRSKPLHARRVRDRGVARTHSRQARAVAVDEAANRIPRRVR